MTLLLLPNWAENEERLATTFKNVVPQVSKAD
jgi:hypothetical protein